MLSQPHLTSQSPSFASIIHNATVVHVNSPSKPDYEESISQARGRGGFIPNFLGVSRPPRQQLMDQEQRSVMRPYCVRSAKQPIPRVPQRPAARKAAVAFAVSTRCHTCGCLPAKGLRAVSHSPLGTRPWERASVFAAFKFRTH
jgi:hypothetical protein